MSISSSLNAGVAGLAANATRLAGISDNIANSGTYGYKRVNTQFEGMVINQARGAGVYSAGGVRAMTSRVIDQKGALISSSHPLDLAISGRDMLPVIPSATLGQNPADRPIMMTTLAAILGALPIAIGAGARRCTGGGPGLGRGTGLGRGSGAGPGLGRGSGAGLGRGS